MCMHAWGACVTAKMRGVAHVARPHADGLCEEASVALGEDELAARPQHAARLLHHLHARSAVAHGASADTARGEGLDLSGGTLSCARSMMEARASIGWVR